MANKKSDYNASDITVLEGLEPVRKRPGMYIGTTSSAGLHHLIKEVFDNARDEAMVGHATYIEVIFLPNDSIRISDNGRGIPVDTHKKTKVSALETILTTLHAGGKFDNKGYKVSGGLHGVGVSVVNALSNSLTATVYRDGGIYAQSYAQGKPKAKVKKLTSTKENGTVITFTPDESIFETTVFDWKYVKQYLRQQAYLTKKLHISFIDLRDYEGEIPTNEEGLFLKEKIKDVLAYDFYFEGGISSYVSFQNRNQKPIHPTIFYMHKKEDDAEVEIALQYIEDIQEQVGSFANNIHTQEGGMHLTGFKTALTRVLNSYAKQNNLIKGDINFTSEDILEGLTAVISIKLPEIQFEGQTKSKLGSTQGRKIVETNFGSTFSTFLEENPNEARAIIKKVSIAYEARQAAKSAKDSVLRKGVLEGFTLPGKLTDCVTKNKDEAELFIVEGQSAGGTARSGRDRRTQAILPLKGKILNVARARVDKMLASEEIKALVISLGTAISDSFDIEKLRYGKVIIATDADVDGAHIRTLLLTLFYYHLREIIENGNLYIAVPPLYKIPDGKNAIYTYTEAEQDVTIKKLEKEGKKVSAVQRYKGLGEMNSDELWETTMDPEKRLLRKVEIKDAEEAKEIFETLMGTDVMPRKAFIHNNAKIANIDI